MVSNSQIFVNSASVEISTGNSRLDGTGAMSVLLTAGHNGTNVNAFTIKALSSNSEGMIRFFIGTPIAKYLFLEVPIPANVQTGISPSIQITKTGSLRMQSGYSLFVSTEVGDSFTVTASGTDWNNCDCV